MSVPPELKAERWRHTLRQLTPFRRHILHLHRIDGLTYAQIAERLSISVDDVERHMAVIILAVHRATKLRRRNIVLCILRRLGLIW